MAVLLCLLLVVPLGLLVIARARAGRRDVTNDRALLVAAVGGLDLRDVVTYTQDCSRMACMLLAHRDDAEAGFVRQLVRDAVAQIDAVARAARLRGALRTSPRGQGTFPAWPDLLLWALGILDTGLVATLIEWRGPNGITDLQVMTAKALDRFSATVGDDEAPLITLFAEELIRLGVITPEDIEDTGGETVDHGSGP